MTGLVFVGMLGPDSHNREELRFVEELSAGFRVVYYLRGVGVKGLRAHQIMSIPRRLTRRARADRVTQKPASLLVIPFRRLARRFNASWIRRQLETIMRGATVDWTLWTRFPSPELADAVDQMPGLRVVYEPIDLYAAAEDLTPGQSRALMEAEARLARRATVVTGGAQLAERFRRAQGGSHWLPFGRDLRQRATGKAGSDGIRRPRLGLVGCLDWRVDEDLLVSLMSDQPDWQLILAGPRVRPWGNRLFRLPNVQWLGRIETDRVRSVIRGFDVALIPYRLTDWTRHCLPVKVFEYLAEGKPVVATHLPELDLLREVVVMTPPDSFGRCVEAALKQNAPGAQEQRRRAADQFTLQERAQQAIKLLQGGALQRVAF